MKYLPWLLAALPILTVLLFWDYLPDRIPMHSSGGKVDKFGNRSDFAGLVLSITGIFSLAFYVAIQALASFYPISQQELNKAYTAAAAGAALLGYVVLIVTLLGANK